MPVFDMFLRKWYTVFINITVHTLPVPGRIVTMITFITALFPEAKGLIEYFKLKQNTTETLYQLFEGEQVCLVITGAGMISAATAVARHFANYPADSAEDLAINLGIAGLSGSCTSDYSVGDLFLVSKITEAATGRTFFPDFLYRHSFPQLPLVTVPTVCNDSSTLVESTLIDMEASSIYQALLPHISPDRMFFFKVVSDIPGQSESSPVSPAPLLAPHLKPVLSFVNKVHSHLQKTVLHEPALTQEETVLVNTIKDRLPMTEAMLREFERLLSYAKLSNKPLECILGNYLDTLDGITIRGKKQAMPYLNRLREFLLNHDASFEEEISYPSHSTNVDKIYQPFFSTVYAEKSVWSDEWQDKLSAAPIFINHYKDVFNRSHQDFAAQKKAPSLILAKKTGTLIYPGAPVCQSFGNEHFYYTSCMMNCIYHCDYCYLQGMYPSGHVVVFVNLSDYFAELEQLIKRHPVYLCVSYDTDLLALEQFFSFVSKWLSFAAEHPDLTLEIRTKSGNPAIFESLAKLYNGKENLKKQIIFAWTVSPEGLCKTTEHGAASLPLRITALNAAKQAGFSVRLCFDPMIFHGGWKKEYSTLVESVFSTVSANDLYDVSIGVFRISTDYLKNMRKKRPDSAIVQYPYITEQGVSHYGKLSEEMVHYLRELLLKHLPEEKIFVWNGGE